MFLERVKILWLGRTYCNLITNKLIQEKIFTNCGLAFDFRAKGKNFGEKLCYCLEKFRQNNREVNPTDYKRPISLKLRKDVLNYSDY